MSDRALYEVTSCSDGFHECLVGSFGHLEAAKEVALFFSQTETGVFIVRGPGTAGITWLQAIYQDGAEVEDCDDA